MKSKNITNIKLRGIGAINTIVAMHQRVAHVLDKDPWPKDDDAKAALTNLKKEMEFVLNNIGFDIDVDPQCDHREDKVPGISNKPYSPDDDIK